MVDIALQGEGVASALFPIHPKAALDVSPRVKILAGRMLFRANGEAHAVDPITEVAAVAAAVACIEEALFDVSSACRQQSSLSVLRALRNNVDHAVHGVRSPDGSTRSTNHLDPVDVFHHYVLNVPVRTCKKRGVNGPAVDQDENGTRQIGSKAANSD